ncbi:acyl carrier protein [Corynebacterium mastitidis]|uniref:Acyl carrier protein n=1 Tax=Corynebacterium mastitidis TaxID=161890 RepID=A0ABU8NWD4_9CORY
MGNLADQLAAKFGAEEQHDDQPEGTLARLARIVADVTGADPQGIDATTPLRDGAGATSLDVVEITVRAEDAFGVRLDGQTVANFATVGDLVEFLDTTSPEKGAE